MVLIKQEMELERDRESSEFIPREDVGKNQNDEEDMSMYYVTYMPNAVNSSSNVPILALDKEKIESASIPQPKIDTSKHHHVFVGDLAPELDADALRAAFAPFGEISECKIIRDPQTLKSKGYGFVTFVQKRDAEQAITAMNGQWLMTRAIRTNWAARKPPQPIKDGQRPAFDEIYNQSSPSNTTVYCGGVMSGLCEDTIREHFAEYGQIMETRIFKEKGYCFVRFNNKEAATNAIINVNGSEMAGQIVKCAWGKESNDNPGVQTALLGSMGVGGSTAGLQLLMPSSYYYPTAAASQIPQVATPTPQQTAATILPQYTTTNYQGLALSGSWNGTNGQLAGSPPQTQNIAYQFAAASQQQI